MFASTYYMLQPREFISPAQQLGHTRSVPQTCMGPSGGMLSDPGQDHLARTSTPLLAWDWPFTFQESHTLLT